MGLDAGFFRVHYDLPKAERRRFAGTVALFAAATSTALFALVFLLRGPIASLLLGDAERAPWIVLAAADVYLGAFSFVPQSLLRIEERARAFSAYAIGRHGLNSALKVAFLAGGHGVTGVLASDAIATGLFALALAPVLARGASRGFCAAPLRAALAFALPKVPHGLLLQVQNLADRRILSAFVPRAEVGLYHQAYTLGAGVKFALAAFEPAWQPFVYAQIGRPDSGTTIARVVTYAWAVFVALALAVAVLGRELLMALTVGNPAFWPAAPVIPVVVLAYLLHGGFLLTSIGIAMEKRARYYPLMTAVTATANVAANLALIPSYGMMGAAWATVLSYAVMAGLGYTLSRRVHPIPFETGRMGRIAGAAALSFAASRLAPEAIAPALAVKAAALAAFPALVVALGALRPEERAWLRARAGRLAPRA
ncbi:MAG: polysaccharide biosynthesis C-terminal domain-containing protein [Acidobacteria bacterium]|nr:polysaccharide biosynthesis C-terminal domain-containing protein [Acidobacteriota bacterium]